MPQPGRTRQGGKSRNCWTGAAASWPEVIQRWGRCRCGAYPPWSMRGDHAQLRVLDSLEAAQRAHRAGVRRLLLLREAKTARNLKKNIRGLQEMRLQYAKVAQNPDADAAMPADLADELLALAFDRAFLQDPWSVRDRAAFEACLEQGGRASGRPCSKSRDWPGRYSPRRTWSRSSLAPPGSQTGRLGEGYAGTARSPGSTVVSWCRRTRPAAQFPRYLKALAVATGQAQDRRHAGSAAHAGDGAGCRKTGWIVSNRLASRGAFDPRLEEMRWMLEELRVSLFRAGPENGPSGVGQTDQKTLGGPGT